MFMRLIKKWVEGKKPSTTTAARPPIKPIQPALVARLAAHATEIIHPTTTQPTLSNSSNKSSLRATTPSCFFHQSLSDKNSCQHEHNTCDETPVHSL